MDTDRGTADLLARYDEQERQGLTEPPVEGLERLAGGVVRQRFADGSGFVTATGLGQGDVDVDAVVAQQVRYFADQEDGRGVSFEWKVYGHDEPADLTERLTAAGFEPQDREAFVVGSTSQVLHACAGACAPPGVRLREVDAKSAQRDVHAVADLHEQVWGEALPGYAERLLADLRARPEQVRLFVAETTEPSPLVVCAARVELRPAVREEGPPVSDFAGLWGGSTLQQWRGRGIYRALVRVRAEAAAAAQVPWLQVDASPDSQPILERLGFHVLDWTQPFEWQPK